MLFNRLRYRRHVLNGVAILLSSICVALGVSTATYAADDAGRLSHYLRRESPLTKIELALGINRAESRQISRLTSVSQSTPTTAQGYRGAFATGRFFNGWGGFKNGERTYGVRGAKTWQRLSGVSNRSRPRQLYGVSSPNSSRSDFGGLFFRWGSDRNLLFRNQPRPHRNEIYGVRWGNNTRILERARWRPQEIYGAGLTNVSGRMYGLRRSAITSRSMSGINVSRPSSLLDRSGFGRRSGLSGKRLFGF